MNVKFEKFKIDSALKASGKSYTFTRYGKNQYGEYTEEEIGSNEMIAIYHKSNTGSYVSLDTNQEYRIKSEKSPMLLTSYDEFLKAKIEIDDVVFVNSQKHKVTGWFNVQEANVVVDVSLEEIQ